MRVRTTCPYCGVGCGVVVRPGECGGGPGDPPPANAGRLCSKGSALGETLGLKGRLLAPTIGSRTTGWNEALDLVAERFAETIERHGPDAVAFYVSGQLLTEDYYVANKLMKGFIGSGNIDTNSRLCMASSVAGHRRAFGEDLVPGCYEDLDEADLVVLVGSNTAWCHPILFRRLLDARQKRGTRLVVVDPRRTATAAEADLHLALDSGTDVLLFNGLLAFLHASDRVDPIFVAECTAGFEEALDLASAEAPNVATVARGCGLREADVATFYEWFAATPRTVTVYSQGVNQSAHGTDKVNAIVNAHLATGRIGRPGMGPFSLTGQPNAMGGREVGGLANQLAAHMDFEHGRSSAWPGSGMRRGWRPARGSRPSRCSRRSRTGASRRSGSWGPTRLSACRMPAACATPCVPATSSPCPIAHPIPIPRPTLTCSCPRRAGARRTAPSPTRSGASRANGRFLPLAGGARPDWWIITEVARRMGFGAAFPYTRPAESSANMRPVRLRERRHAHLRHRGPRRAHGRGLRRARAGPMARDSRGSGRDGAPPRRWPISDREWMRPLRCRPPGRAGPRRLGRAAPGPEHRAPARPMAHHDPHGPCPAAHDPHAGARGRPPSGDAASKGIHAGDLVRIASRWGGAVVRARLAAEQPRGAAFLPMHWSDRFTANGSAGRLANPAVDPWSGQPELKHTPVAIERIPAQWEGFLVSRRSFRPTGFVYWTRTTIPGGYLYILAGPEPARQGILLGRRLMEYTTASLEFTDLRRDLYRAAVLDVQDHPDRLPLRRPRGSAAGERVAAHASRRPQAPRRGRPPRPP